MNATATLGVGDVAPPFQLTDQNGRLVSSVDMGRGRNLLVVFYPFAFSGVCTGELREIRDDLGSFVADDIHVLAVSCDPVYALRAWADLEGYFFPLLSDFWPHGAVARKFGVFDEAGGFAHRGTFLIGTDGRVRWSLFSDITRARDFSGYHEALAELR